MEKEKEEKLTDEEELKTAEEHIRERFQAVFPALEEGELSEGLDELYREHPEADVQALVTDPLFAEYAKGRGADIAGIYEGYTAFAAAMEADLSEKLKRRRSRFTSTGSARATETRAGLSDAQMALLEEWNRREPDYKMTAREYAAALKN